jgi:uncharacterized protein (TIGR02246 family)
MSLEEIVVVNRDLEDAIAKGDMDRLAALYTQDAILLPPDAQMVRGRDAIREFWSGAAEALGLKSVKLETVDLQLAGQDTACEVGAAQLELAPAGGEATTATIKYMVAWLKIDGAWRLHRDIWNATP